MISIMPLDFQSFIEGAPVREVGFAAGEAIFHSGDAVRSVYFVRLGTIHLLRRQPDGAELILQRAGPGSVLAEASLYAARYHCDARASTAVTALVIARHELRRRLEENADFGVAWARHLGHELQRARLQSEILSLKTVAARLDAWIAWRGDLPEKGGWSTVAREIGVSPEALYREIGRRRLSRWGPKGATIKA